MYAHLDSLIRLPGLLGALKSVDQASLLELRQRHPQAPEEYLSFLSERGHGPLDDGSPLPPFTFFSRLVNAAEEIYGNGEIYTDGPHQPGAKGVVWAFGSDSIGTTFGFDSGDEWRILQIDNFRWVERLGLTFKQFVEGLLVCYPQFPKHFRDEAWFDSAGKQYGVSTS